MVVLDASNSMTESYKGQPKINIAKDFISRMNDTIPELKLNGALRVFGQSFMLSPNSTVLTYGITNYTKAGFRQGIDAIKGAGGATPMTKGIKAASKDFESTQGKIALIIVSDGKDLNNSPVEAAMDMKRQYGARLCIYSVLVGNNPKGADLMKMLADAGQCGFSVNADDVTSSEALANFVAKVFLTKQLDSDGDGIIDSLDQCPDTPKGVMVDAKGCPLDTDGDGVYDYLDQCPNTPRGVKVDTKGCPLDTDGDGVYDYLDQCPDTPQGVKVDTKGCPLDADGDGVYDYLDKCLGTPKGAEVDDRGCWILKNVTFDTNKWDIKERYYFVLDNVVTVMRENPSLSVEVQGHTDSRGTEKYNQKLSEKRARSVVEYLVRNGIESSRLTAVGFGPKKPVASNATDTGMVKNRRVELRPTR
jgi:OOP family OmpA-OmpF porin